MRSTRHPKSPSSTHSPGWPRALFVRRLERHWDWTCEQQLCLSLLLINVDGFQAFSAAAAQQQVDDALTAIAVCIAECCQRRSDFVGRVRNDEFAILLADVEMAGVETMARRLQDAIHALALPDHQGGQLRVGIGAVAGVPHANRFAHSVSIAADHALRAAKARGPGQLEIRPLD